MAIGTMLFNPFTGTPRHPSDIASDPRGILIWDGEEPLRAANPAPLADDSRDAGRLLRNLQTWLICRETGQALAPSLTTIQGWLSALGAITGEAPPEFVMKAQERDNSRCKFAAGGACCVSHCGDPSCIAASTDGLAKGEAS